MSGLVDIPAIRIAVESEARQIEECTTAFHVNPSLCMISCFFHPGETASSSHRWRISKRQQQQQQRCV